MIWLLLASLAAAQEVSTTSASIPIDTQIEISNLGKDTRNILSGRYTQTGKPTFKNGVCYGDGSCPLVGAGLASTQTFSGANTFTGAVSISSWTTQNLAETGYAKIGPVIFQWGVYKGGVHGPTITFPIPFTQGFSVTGNCLDNVANGCSLTIASTTTLTFVGRQDRHDATPETSNFTWEAKGR